MSLPRDVMDKLKVLNLVAASSVACYEAAWDINRGRWDCDMKALHQLIMSRTGRGTMTLEEMIEHMRAKGV